MKRIVLVALLLLLVSSGNTFAEALHIHWTPSTAQNLVRYVVYRSTSATTGFVAIDSVGVTPADTAYTDNTVPTGTRLYYRLRAVAADGQRSVLSDPVNGFYIPTTDPAPVVKILTITKLSPRTYRVTWSTTEPSVGFLFSRVVGTAWTASTWDILLTTSHTTTLTLTEPASYEFRAAAYYTPSPTSVTVSPSFFATLVPTPEPPTTKGIYPF